MRSRGQSLIEIAAILGIIALAVIAMQTFMKRKFQGQVKELTDRIINPQGLALRPYEQANATSKTMTEVTSSTATITSSGGGMKKTLRESTDTTSTSWSKKKP